MKYFLYDTETGGNKINASILTLYGVVCNEKFEVVDTISLKIRPNDGIYRVEAEALAINKINLVEHDKVAVTQSVAAQTLRWFLENHSENGEKITVGGWNNYWDNSFIQAHLLPDLNDLISRHLLDVASTAVLLKTMGLLPGDLKLSLVNLVKHYNVEFENGAHDAQSDIMATVAVFKCMQKQLTSGNH